MRPLLERTLDLSCEYAEFFAPYQHVIDPFIDDMDEGMTCASVRALFAELRAELVPLVRAICERPPGRRQLPARRVCRSPAARLRPRASRPPTATTSGAAGSTAPRIRSAPGSRAGDVRITTRVYPDDVTQALFSTLHEAGHGMYEQGVAPALDGTPLGSGTSAGVHESQSRLWENVVGRSRGLWQHYYPKLRATFPERLGKVPLETFYRAINKVERSLIRTEADEVTYNLHIILRFDLEIEMLERRLAVKDLPEAWRARYQSDLGDQPARRPGRLPAGRALVRRLHRRRLPQLHDRQCAERPVLRRGAARPSGNSRGDRRRPVRDAEGLARAESLSPRPQVSSRRDRAARHRRADDHPALHGVSEPQIRRAVRVARSTAEAAR